MNKLLVIGLIVGLVIGAGIGYWYASSTLRAKFQGYFPPILPQMTAISGTVKSVDDSTITMEIAPSNNPFDEWPTTRVVNVTSKTIIVTSATTAQNSNKSNLKISDIKPGQNVYVTAGGNIKTAASFDAELIRVGRASVIGNPAPADAGIRTPPPAVPAD